VVPARDVALDGAVVYSCDPTLSDVDWLLRRGLPMVFVDQDPVEGIPSVNVDDRAGAHAAAAHLVGLGHRRVAIMTAALGGVLGVLADPLEDLDRSKHASRERLLGYLDALGAAGVTPIVHRQSHNDDEAAYAGALDLLGRDDRPTGVLCFSDVIAHGVVRAAEQLGLDVPGDLSVVGFDDSPLARRLRPQLTTVRQDVEGKGRVSAAELRRTMAAVEHREPLEVRRIVLPTELVVRDSTAPPRG
jgi:DNA-binding LacI/PurR family transcriptional regulator